MVKQKNKLTISIGIPAYNEEANIKNLLFSIISQKEIGFVIKEIIVISDGSTDGTVKAVKSVDDPRITLIESKKREGKSSRLNSLFRMADGDIIVLLDADILLDNNFVIERLIKKFKTNGNIGLISGNAKPLPAQTFIEAAANNFLYARERVKDTYNFASSGNAAVGRILAYSKKFAKLLTFPPNLLADDGFAYMACKTKGFKFFYQEDAVVWIRSPQTIKDYINQATRFLAGKPQLYEHFDNNSVDSEYYVPSEVQIRIMLFQLIRNPLGWVTLKVLYWYCLRRSLPYLEKLDARWIQVGSSKQLIGNKVKSQ